MAPTNEPMTTDGRRTAVRRQRTVRLANEEVERRLKRPLKGDPTRGERGVMNTLRSDGLEEARRLLQRDETLGEDFKELVSEVLTQAGGRAPMTSWRVRLAPVVWEEYARESRSTGVTLSDCLSAAVTRDYERRLAGHDPLDVLTREVRSYHTAAAHVLDEVRRLGITAADTRSLVRRVERLEEWAGRRNRSP
jgi:hypothetical protein